MLSLATRLAKSYLCWMASVKTACEWQPNLRLNILKKFTNHSAKHSLEHSAEHALVRSAEYSPKHSAKHSVHLLLKIPSRNQSSSSSHTSREYCEQSEFDRMFGHVRQTCGTNSQKHRTCGIGAMFRRFVEQCEAGLTMPCVVDCEVVTVLNQLIPQDVSNDYHLAICWDIAGDGSPHHTYIVG